jgi:hypothetical protein
MTIVKWAKAKIFETHSVMVGELEYEKQSPPSNSKIILLLQAFVCYLIFDIEFRSITSRVAIDVVRTIGMLID